MLDPAALSLWLRISADHATALAQLVESADLKIVTDADLFSVERGHADPVTHFETGTTLPSLPNSNA